MESGTINLGNNGGGGGGGGTTSGSTVFGGETNAGPYGGNGGAGLGGAIFVRNGGSLTLKGTISFANNTTLAGKGGNTSLPGDAAKFLEDKKIWG